MQYTHTTQTPTSDAVDTIVGNIEQFIADKSLDTVHAAMAYVELVPEVHNFEAAQTRILYIETRLALHTFFSTGRGLKSA